MPPNPNDDCRPSPPDRPDTPDANVKFWHYFSGRADALNDKLWTQVTWLLGLAGTLVAYIVHSEVIAWSGDQRLLVKPWPMLVLGLVGITLCLFGMLLIWDVGKHIKRNWWRQEHFSKDISILRAAFESEKSVFGRSQSAGKQTMRDQFRSIPPVCLRLFAIVAGFMALFVLGILLAIIRMVSS